MIDQRAERFETLRPELVRHAYRMLGEYGEAEDVAQDAYLRWSAALDSTQVEDEHALARTIVTRLCLDRLRSARAKREVYVGPWLPEPVISEGNENPEAAATMADDISFALLLALERLAPLERAAFLLHDVLDVPFDEVASTLGRAEPAVRKLASRAREHVRDSSRHSRTDPAELRRVRDAFLAALQNDDPALLAQLLTEDVVFTSDGGGKVPAAAAPLVGRERVTRLLFGLKEKGWRQILRTELVMLNGLPGILTFNKDGMQDVIALEIVDGLVAAMYVVRNPEKFRGVTASPTTARISPRSFGRGRCSAS
ncbi:MAG TPA: RNA polymerase sigma factor SigJ [Candidatus Cybelea sp.]|jgi:RNA polymerase sigma-70 factor (ECF subfamily)